LAESFIKDEERVCIIGGSKVFLPSVDNDVIFIFSHILQHFFNGGIGIRQICDWCRLLWAHKDAIDLTLLRNRLEEMRAMSEWKVFTALAVNNLGTPAEAMPFYSPASCWKRKASRVLDIIFETGNFGHNRDLSFLSKYPFAIRNPRCYNY